MSRCVLLQATRRCRLTCDIIISNSTQTAPAPQMLYYDQSALLGGGKHILRGGPVPPRAPPSSPCLDTPLTAGLLVFVFPFQLLPRTVYIWSSGTDRDTTTLHQRLVETENLTYTKMSKEQQLRLHGHDENGKCILIQSLRYSLTSLKIVKMQ